MTQSIILILESMLAVHNEHNKVGTPFEVAQLGKAFRMLSATLREQVSEDQLEQVQARFTHMTRTQNVKQYLLQLPSK